MMPPITGESVGVDGALPAPPAAADVSGTGRDNGSEKPESDSSLMQSEPAGPKHAAPEAPAPVDTTEPDMGGTEIRRRDSIQAQRQRVTE
jgi:hypothetical protein